MRQLAVAFLMFSSALLGQTYTISTFAGGGPPDNVAATSIGLDLNGGYWGNAVGVAADAAGNLFFASGYAVFRLDRAKGTVTRVAGNGIPPGGFSGDNGPATSAQILPIGVAVDAAGANVYISDVSSDRIRKVSNGVITTVAGNGTYGFSGDSGPATGAQLADPLGLAVDSVGDLYIADTNSNRIRKVSNGVITTVAGSGGLAVTGLGGFSGDNGPATSAKLNGPTGVAVDAGGIIYIADGGNHRIRKVSNGVITTVAGNGIAIFSGDNGPATSASLWFPRDVAVDATGNLYIADDGGNNRIRQVSNGVITTVAGTGTYGFSGDNGPAASAQLSNPNAVAVDAAGDLYIADAGNHRIRMVSNGVIATIAGTSRLGSGDNGPATSAQIPGPTGVAVDSAGALYITDSLESTVRKVSNGVITTVVGVGGGLNLPSGAAIDAAGNLYVADSFSPRILMVSNGVVTTVAGNGTYGFSGDNGPATSAQLNSPAGVAVDAGGSIYIADTGNSCIRKVSNGVITKVVGLCNQGSQYEGVAVDAAGNLYIADSGHNRILMVSNGVVTTVAGSGTYGFSGDNGPATSASLRFPTGVAVDAVGAIYIADTYNYRIRKVSNGVITTIAGTGSSGFSGDDGPATSAQLNLGLFSPFCCCGPALPTGVAVDSQENVYVADGNNGRIRVLALNGGRLTILSPSLLTSGRERTPFGPIQFSAVGGAGVSSWAATGLPSGLTISAAGVLSGIPASGTHGSYNPVFTATDSKGAMASVNLSLTIIAPPPAITSVGPNLVQGFNANQTLFINGSGFISAPGLTVQLIWPTGQVDLPAAMVTLFNSTQLSVSFNFSVTYGNWTAQVINPDGQISNIFFFSVVAPGAGTTTHFALPHFVFGGAWYTALYFSNTSNFAVNVVVDFIADDGSPLTVTLAGIGSVSSQIVSLSPGATMVLEALNGGNQTTDGWVEVALPPGIIGYAVFRQVVVGRANQEALVQFTPETSQTADLTYDESGLGTSVAFLNPSSQQVTVTITAYGPDGAQVGTTQVPLAPRSKQATVLETLPGLSGMFGKRGRVVFSVPNGAVSVLGLRFGPEAFTSIPVTHR